MESEATALVSGSTMHNLVDYLEDDANNNVGKSTPADSLKCFKDNNACPCGRKIILSKPSVLETIKSEDEKSDNWSSTPSYSIKQSNDKRHRSISEGHFCDAINSDVCCNNCIHSQTFGRQISVCPSRTSNDSGICSCNGSNSTSITYLKNKPEQDTSKFNQNIGTCIKHSESDVEFGLPYVSKLQEQAFDIKNLQEKLKDQQRSLRCVAFLTALLILITTVILAVLIFDWKRQSHLNKDEIINIVDGQVAEKQFTGEICVSCDNVMYLNGGSTHLEYSVKDGLCCLQNTHTFIEALAEKMRNTQTSFENPDDTNAIVRHIQPANTVLPDPSTIRERSALHLNGTYSKETKEIQGKFTWDNKAAATSLVLVANGEKIKVGTSANYFLYVGIKFKSTSNSTRSVGFEIKRFVHDNKSIYTVVNETNVVHFYDSRQEHDCRSERVLYFNENDVIYINVKEDHLLAPSSHVFGMFEI